MSSDRLRAVVGAGERDQRASRDAFELLDLIVAKRLRRGLTTVVDSTGLEREAPRRLAGAGRREGVPAYAVVVDTPEKVVRERNRARGTPVPAKVVAAQLREAAGGRATRSPARGSRASTSRARSSSCRPRSWAPRRPPRAREDPLPLEFGLQLSRFDWDGHPAATARRSPTSRARPRRRASRASG